MNMVYDILDQYLLGGTQWGWTPNWNYDLKDGWNRENFSITDVRRNLRSNYAIRAYPRAIAGSPGLFKVWHFFRPSFTCLNSGLEQTDHAIHSHLRAIDGNSGIFKAGYCCPHCPLPAVLPAMPCRRS